jgi:hypothetical protein
MQQVQKVNDYCTRRAITLFARVTYIFLRSKKKARKKQR